MRSVIFGVLAAVAFGSAATAQSFDTLEEAWSVAARNGVDPATWTAVTQDERSAAFIKNTPEAAGPTVHWAAMIDADELDFSLFLLDFNCRDNRYRFLQQSSRDWRGNNLSSGGATDWAYADPGSVAESLFRQVCPLAVIVPGPPVTLPIEPRRGS